MTIAYAGGDGSAQPGPRTRPPKKVAYVYAPQSGREVTAKRLVTMLLNFLPGQRLKITFERDVPTRSTLQNKALWGCAYKALEEQSGNDPEDLHRYFCGEFFGWEKHEVMGAWTRRPKRTTTTNEQGERDVIDKLRMAEFYDFIQDRAAKVGFDVPDPDPEWFMKSEPRKAA